MLNRKRSLSILTTAAFLAVLTGCGTAQTAPQEEGTQVEEAGGQSGPEAVEKAQVGDTVTLGDLKITVSDVQYTRGEGDEAAPDGYTYVIVDAAVENTGEKSFFSRPMIHFQVMTGEGFTFDRVALTDLKGNLEAEIPAGGQLAGQVAFQVPMGAKGLDLIYTPDVLNQDLKAVFSLGDVE